MNDLTARDFDEAPLWAGYYEPDDIAEIVRWGVADTTVRAALDAIGWEDDHYFPLPVEAVQSRWGRGKLYAATATGADGTEFTGYVGERRDYIVLFVEDTRCVLSTRLPELNPITAVRLPLHVLNRVTNERWSFSLP